MIDIAELKLRLIKENILSDAYCINCKFPIEQYCLMHENGAWFVYYSERGIKRNEVTFKNESDACEYFLEKLLKDPTTRKK